MPEMTAAEIQSLLDKTVGALSKVKSASCEVRTKTTFSDSYKKGLNAESLKNLKSIEHEEYFWAWKPGYFVRREVRFFSARDAAGVVETTELITPEGVIFFNGPAADSQLIGFSAQGSITRRRQEDTMPMFLDYGYRIGTQPLSVELKNSKFVYKSESTSENMGRVVKLEAPDKDQRIQKIEIAVDRGPFVTYVKGRRSDDPSSSSVEFRTLQLFNAHGFWVPSAGAGALLDFEGKPVRMDQVSFMNPLINEVSDKTFILNFPPNTLVQNEITGKSYRTKSTKPVDLLIPGAMVALVVAAGVIAYLRLKKKPA